MLFLWRTATSCNKALPGNSLAIPRKSGRNSFLKNYYGDRQSNMNKGHSDIQVCYEAVECHFYKRKLGKSEVWLLDFIASSYAGKDNTGVAKLKRIAGWEGGLALAPVLYHAADVTPAQSALINGFMGHALDYDDVHLQVHGHPRMAILPVNNQKQAFL